MASRYDEDDDVDELNRKPAALTTLFDGVPDGFPHSAAEHVT
jgi:hypothetical protein